MTQKTVLTELIEDITGCSTLGQIQKVISNPKYAAKERQDLIDAHDSKFKILEQVVNSNGATVTYQDGKTYVHEKFGI